MTKKVYGVALNDVPRSTMTNPGIYTAWHGMLTRCFSLKYQNKYPTYVGCTIDPAWMNYSGFYSWAIENYREGLHLDKDILLSGNKHYSAETCVFIPHWLNTFVSNMKKKPRDLPMGVHRSRKKFGARFGCRDTGVFIGSFATAEEAGSAYMTYRRAEIEKRIRDYRDSEYSDGRVVRALIDLFLADECAIAEAQRPSEWAQYSHRE